MTAISEPFVLASITNEALAFNDVCVQPGPSANTAVVTHGQMSASLVEVEDCRPVKVKSWNTSHTHPFTCPVVYDASRDKYVAVSRKSVILLPPEATDMPSRDVLPLLLPVFRLLPRVDREPVLVMQDGSCTTISALEIDGHRKLVKLDNTEKLVHAELAPSADSCDSVVLLVTATKPSGHRVRVISLDEAGSASLEQDEKVTLAEGVAFCLLDGQVLVLASDGALRLISKSGRKSPGSLPAGTVSMPCCMTSLDAKRILVATDDRIDVWNLAFMTLEASKVFTVTASKAIRGVRVLPGSVCFMGGKSSNDVMCSPISLKAPVLCQAVGLGSRVEDKLPAASKLASSLLSNDKATEQILQDFETVADDIPETELVSLLHRLLSAGNKFSTNEDTLLKNVLRCPHNCDALASRIRQGLPFDEACALLVYLLDFLESYSFADAEDVPIGKAMDWAACVLDAHFSQFSMSREEHIGELMERLIAVMARVQGLFSDLGEVEQWLLVLSKRVKLLKFDDRGLYSIEMLEI